MELGPLSNLHPKEGDAGEKIHCGFEVLESLRAAGWEVILWKGEERWGYGRRSGDDGRQRFRGDTRASKFQEVC